MTVNFFLINHPDWQQEAQGFIIQKEYSKAASLYEQAVEAEPQLKSHYWYLGTILLLQGQEVEAQTTWLLAMVEGEPEEIDLWTAELTEVLQVEVARQEALEDYTAAWLLRCHIREIHPTELFNLLRLIELAVQLQRFTGEELTDWNVIERLHQQQPGSLEADFLLPVLKKVLDTKVQHPSLLEFAALCMPHVHPHPNFFEVMLPAAMELSYSLQPARAAFLMELCLRIDDSHPEIWRHLATFYQDAGFYSLGIEMAQRCYFLVDSLPEKVFANHLRLRGLMSAGGYWQEALSTLKVQESLLWNLTEAEADPVSHTTVSRLLTSTFFFPYFRDNPQENKLLQNRVSQRCQNYFQSFAPEAVERYHQHRRASKATKTNPRNRPLKIGYISNCLRNHSVGWLARSLFQHHNPELFEIHAYFVAGELHTAQPIHQWYLSQVPHPHQVGVDNVEIADRIHQDDIDILIDLDSLTLDMTCEVMALKPAPVQVTWLGWDASGLPAIDYFIADPYVLPEEAQHYYPEKIWRLPQTYIAVDGFEVGVPNLRRDRLNIPQDAVVYFSGQTGYKRHPDTARLQMQIIKAVPNSYFLIKGFAEQESIKRFFIQLAEEEGVEGDRLRFLPPAPSEAIHRANLGIADVVLDTYPYNGATTTLETLWMGIPVVTKVGKQFAACNSYTMMMNVGVSEGISWTDQEYVEWGIRLGKDAKLRQHISGRLRASRQTSPLWNGKQFTREMENAYVQMRLKYLETMD
ncbi:O-linked N-acetylglucosamine transferase [Oscillatoria acuminata]|uniref:Putative O-linked N-acetylglucosamine transferase, SPINDLY family n=1 Tax=Oscillatoria acuminata PCC 6304 TaxID=56110 RepID=K9TD33_9CYAN|nr:O-linked N-acetylglucosamine transferase [Oscillatoria acuminata]AFY80051.1 putative O-linked N-acetylglucosamine transferase, SPINDLY family [Oscillatoria acuminata PCC 6304]